MPSAWPYHEYLRDYWRFSPDDIQQVFSDLNLAVLETDEGKPSLVYAKMIKPAGFVERDLAAYPLYRILTGTRVTELPADVFKSWPASRVSRLSPRRQYGKN